MTDDSWAPRFRTRQATVTKALHSPAFTASRSRAEAIVDDAAALRHLVEVVERLDHESPPLSTVADRVAAAGALLRRRADGLDAGVVDSDAGDGASVARVRLVVAALHYLVTPVDLVPDFRPGGYVDDVLLLSWVFGAAVDELTPYLSPELEPEV